MPLTVLQPPVSPVLSLAEARAQARVDAWGSPLVHRDDDLLTAFVAGATQELDGPDGWLGRALVTQTLKLTLDGFDSHRACSTAVIPLPLSPVQSITSVTYIDTDGVEQTLESSAYRAVIAADPAYIEPVYGTSWPTTRPVSGSVAITYVAGYGDPEDVPEIIRNYIRARVAQLYAHRELVISGTIIAPVPFMRDNLESIRLRGVRR